MATLNWQDYFRQARPCLNFRQEAASYMPLGISARDPLSLLLK
jgi:hypothetical protein